MFIIFMYNIHLCIKNMKKKDVENVHLILWKQFLNKLIYIMEIMPLRSQEFLDFGQV